MLMLKFNHWYHMYLPPPTVSTHQLQPWAKPFVGLGRKTAQTTLLNFL